MVPALESSMSSVDELALSSKKGLEERRGSLAVQPFLHELCKRCHHATNFNKWWTSDSLYEVQYFKLFEPYVVLNRKKLIQCKDYFAGRFYNKISLFNALKHYEYKFIVAPGVFFAHPCAKSCLVATISVYEVTLHWSVQEGAIDLSLTLPQWPLLSCACFLCLSMFLALLEWCSYLESLLHTRQF